MMSFANAENCNEPDCVDGAISDAIQRAFALLPIAVLAAAAGLR